MNGIRHKIVYLAHGQPAFHDQARYMARAKRRKSIYTRRIAPKAG